MSSFPRWYHANHYSPGLGRGKLYGTPMGHTGTHTGRTRRLGCYTEGSDGEPIEDSRVMDETMEEEE